MLYNVETNKVKCDLDCLECKHYDPKTLDCKGIGVACFEYDPTTATCIDPITKLPFNPNDKK